MGGILDKLLGARGETVATLKRTGLGKVLRRNGVMAESEFQRIDLLPRRDWENDPDLEDKIELATSYLRRPNRNVRLWGIQAVALIEAAECQGLLAGVRVGGGKTLGSLGTASMPVLEELERPVLFVPSKHREKTERAFRDLSEDWKLNRELCFVNYEELSDIARHEWLFKYQPKLIICDEAHKLRNDNARRARFEAYLEAYPDTVVILWSGTFMRKTVRDLQAFGEWTLGDGSPVPRTWKICEDWCGALDPGSKTPMAPGALARWCTPEEQLEGISGVRSAFGRRLAETPGVVISSGAAAVDCGLEITVQLIEHPEAEAAFEQLREWWELPDGWTIRDAPVWWESARQLSEGFYYYPDPRPPKPWSDARKAWHGLCRDMQADEDEDLVSELMVKQACERLGAEAPVEYLQWMAIEPTFKINQKALWFSDALLERVAAWMKRHKGIVWIEHKAIGKRLQELTGVPYFGDGADARCEAFTGNLMDYTGRNAICSLTACGEGFDLQYWWSNNLLVTPHPNGTLWEQFLARTHRFWDPLKAPQGCPARPDVITCEVWVKCREDFEAIFKAIAEEKNVSTVMRDPYRKLVVADWFGLPSFEDLHKRTGYAWRKKKKADKQKALAAAPTSRTM